MIALIPVRDGVLPAGAPDAIAEAGGRALIAGSGTADAPVDGIASRGASWRSSGPVELGRWAAALAPIIEALPDSDIVVLPHAPDGRDLAPRLAAALERPLLAGATEVTPHRVRVARRGGLELHELRPTGPFVATVQPGARGGLTLDTPPIVQRHRRRRRHRGNGGRHTRRPRRRGVAPRRADDGSHRGRAGSSAGAPGWRATNASSNSTDSPVAIGE